MYVSINVYFDAADSLIYVFLLTANVELFELYKLLIDSQCITYFIQSMCSLLHTVDSSRLALD